MKIKIRCDYCGVIHTIEVRNERGRWAIDLDQPSYQIVEFVPPDSIIEPDDASDDAQTSG